MGKIDGRALADKTFEGLKEKAAALRHSGFTPSLRVVMVGDDPASASYVGGKERDCRKVGIDFSRLILPASSTQASVDPARQRPSLPPGGSCQRS